VLSLRIGSGVELLIDGGRVAATIVEASTVVDVVVGRSAGSGGDGAWRVERHIALDQY
jgi:hypothetical protein